LRFPPCANPCSVACVAAPGVDVLVAEPGGAYGFLSGTSMAAAHVSGVIALMLDAKPDLEPKAVRDVLFKTAKHLTPTERDNDSIAGIVDAYGALEDLDAQQRLKTALSSSSTNIIALQNQLNAANALAARLGSEKDQLAAAGEAEAQARTKALADANDRLEIANNQIADLERQLRTVQDAPGHSVEKTQTSASQKPGRSEETVAPPSVKFRKRENEDIADNAMISKKGISLKQCESLCITNNKCLGYTFNQWDNFCFIKSTISGLKQNPRTISFIRNDIPLPALVKFDVKKHDGKEFKTEGYKIFSSKDTDTCKNACEKDDNCFAFTFRKLVGKCHLIHTTNEEYQPNPDADSGAVAGVVGI